MRFLKEGRIFCGFVIYFFGGILGELLVDDLTCSQQGRDSIEIRIFLVSPLRNVTLCLDDSDQEDYWLRFGGRHGFIVLIDC